MQSKGSSNFQVFILMQFRSDGSNAFPTFSQQVFWAIVCGYGTSHSLLLIQIQ